MDNLHTFLLKPLQIYLNPQESGLALAITFGIKNALDKGIANEVKMIGVSHMMVLSGANITMFITFISSALPFLPYKLRDVVAMIITSTFLSFIPMQPSIVRAVLMNYIPRIGVLFGKRSHGLYLLFFTCALILCFDSHIVYDISFQLSFLAIFGMSILYKTPEENMHDKNIVNNIISSIKEQTSLGFSAQAFTVPLLFYYFGNISLISPIANLLLSTLISPIMICTTIVIMSGNGKILPIFNDIFGISLHILLIILISITHTLSTYKILYIQY